MLSGESTPLLKESIELREGSDILDMNGSDRNNVLFSGTKALQVEKPQEEGGIHSKLILALCGKADDQLLMKDVLLLYSGPVSVPPKDNSLGPCSSPRTGFRQTTSRVSCLLVSYSSSLSPLVPTSGSRVSCPLLRPVGIS
jgi:hypothetical protein